MKENCLIKIEFEKLQQKYSKLQQQNEELKNRK